MNALLPSAPPPDEALIPVGTTLRVDDGVRFIERGLISGGSPWRLLRLPGRSADVVARWREGGTVRAGEERLARTLVQQGFVYPRFEGPFLIDELDVVIPVCDDAASLTSLLAQLEGFHVTVVDDGSVNAVELAAHVAEHGATLVRLEENHGPAFARNAGAANGGRPLLWFVDADVSLEGADEIARSLQSDFADPLVGATAPRVRGADGPTRREKFEHHFGALDLGAKSGLAVPSGAIGYVPSACLMVRRAAYGNGFDESLRSGEDVDFVWRLHDEGWLVRYRADVVVTHRARTSWLGWWRQRERYGESSAELSSRHGSRLAPLRVDPWTLAAWGSVLLGQPAVGARIVASARRHARETTFANDDNAESVANQVVAGNMVRAGGPLARAAVRTFGAALLLCALHPRLRTRALGLFVLGTAWRWRHHRIDPADIPLAVADDLAYGAGVMHGAWKMKSLAPLTPEITKSSLSVREALGLGSSTGARTASNYSNPSIDF